MHFNSHKNWLSCCYGSLLLMPLGMVIAHRSAPVFVVFSAIMLLVFRFSDAPLMFRKIQHTVSGAYRSHKTSLLLAVLICLLTLFFLVKNSVIFTLFEAILSLGAGMIVFFLLPRPLPRWFFPALLIISSIACFAILFELRTGSAWRVDWGLRRNSFVFNRPLIVLTLLLAPLSLHLLSRYKIYGLGGALFYAILLGYTLSKSDSGAGLLGFLCALLIFIAARFLPKITFIKLTTGIVCAFIFAPVLGKITENALPLEAHQKLAEAHSFARMKIWQGFGEAVTEAPLKNQIFGQGFGAANADLIKKPIKEYVSPELAPLLASGHPHNMPLQIWVELGFLGVFSMLTILFFCVVYPLKTGTSLTKNAFAAHCSLVACAFSIAMVGHGAWQGWWLAALGWSAVLLRDGFNTGYPK
jgi:exopolysaccharide production protein ExoQ